MLKAAGYPLVVELGVERACSIESKTSFLHVAQQQQSCG